MFLLSKNVIGISLFQQQPFRLTKTMVKYLLLASLCLMQTIAYGNSFSVINHGAADSNEQIAFDSINAFRANPPDALYGAFVDFGYTGTKADFDSLLQSQASYPGNNWWSSNFGFQNLMTWSMDAFGTVPLTLLNQFAALPAAGTLSSFVWHDNIGWAAHQYAVWVENDAGASPNPHAVAGAPSLLNRLVNNGVQLTSVGENIAANWPNSPLLIHNGFMIDWGTGIDGIQSPPGHRNSMLSSRTHVGIGHVDKGWVVDRYTQVQHIVSVSGFSPLVYGYITDCAGDPVSSASVIAYDANGNNLGTASTDLQGAYTIQYTGGSPDYVTVDDGATVLSSLGQAALGQNGSNYFMDISICSNILCNGLPVTVNLNLGETTTSNDDVVLGTPGDDDIRGKAGNDTICGMGGNDFIHGNSGDDWIDGGSGVDNLRGGQGSDTIYTGTGATVGTSSRAFGGYQNDFIYGGPDDDDLRGGRGDDLIMGDEGDDQINGNEDDDTLYGDAGNDTLKGGNGENDQLFGNAGVDSLNGGSGSNDLCDGGGDAGDTMLNCEI